MKKWIISFLLVFLAVGLLNPTYAMESKSSSNLKGIDVSHWEGTIDWAQVSKSGVNFAYMKATEGSSIKDSQFANYVKEAKAQGIPVGAYHYAKVTSPYKPEEPVNEATFFVETMKTSMPDYGDIMPVLDLEENGGLSQADLVKWVQTFVNTVEQATNRQVMLYISEDFIQKNGYTNLSLNSVPLWIAYWDEYYGGQNPPDISGWNQWTAWQYSSKATVPGVTIPVDVNVGPTSLDALKGYLSTMITMHIGSNQAMINGQANQLDAAPFTVQNRTMVPIRFISEGLGAKVDWNPTTRNVTIQKADKTVVLTVDQTTATVNGSTVNLDVPAQITNSRTFVPLRMISENLGQQVDYIPDGQTISIH